MKISTCWTTGYPAHEAQAAIVCVLEHIAPKSDTANGLEEPEFLANKLSE